MVSADALAELRRVGEQLRAIFSEERRAISTLDHAALEAVSARKQEVALRLAALRDAIAGADPDVRDLFTTIRTEAHATALLASAATKAVRELLGYQPAGGYDRRAQATTSRVGRVLATY